VILAVALVIGGAVAGAATTPNVRGALYRGPNTPFCVVEVPCERPAAGVTLVFSRAGKEPVRVRTGRLGRFAVRLVPGRYEIRLPEPGRIGTRISPRTVRVPSAGVIELQLHLDTGIR
jgi:hypothetical protein